MLVGQSELVGGGLEKTERIAVVSVLSFSGVAVPCALM